MIRSYLSVAAAVTEDSNAVRLRRALDRAAIAAQGVSHVVRVAVREATPPSDSDAAGPRRARNRTLILPATDDQLETRLTALTKSVTATNAGRRAETHDLLRRVFDEQGAAVGEIDWQDPTGKKDTWAEGEIDRQGLRDAITKIGLDLSHLTPARLDELVDQFYQDGDEDEGSFGFDDFVEMVSHLRMEEQHHKFQLVCEAFNSEWFENLPEHLKPGKRTVHKVTQRNQSVHRRLSVAAAGGRTPVAAMGGKEHRTPVAAVNDPRLFDP